jgi:hypothetical protein
LFVMCHELNLKANTRNTKGDITDQFHL